MSNSKCLLNTKGLMPNKLVNSGSLRTSLFSSVLSDRQNSWWCNFVESVRYQVNESKFKPEKLSLQFSNPINLEKASFVQATFMN